MENNRNNKKKPVSKQLNIKTLAIRAVIVVAAVYFVCSTIWQQSMINEKNAEIKALQQSVEEQIAESERLNQELEKLNDPEYIEQIAREKLGLVRPNERVFIDSNKSESNDNE